MSKKKTNGNDALNTIDQQSTNEQRRSAWQSYLQGSNTFSGVTKGQQEALNSAESKSYNINATSGNATLNAIDAANGRFRGNSGVITTRSNYWKDYSNAYQKTTEYQLALKRAQEQAEEEAKIASQQAYEAWKKQQDESEARAASANKGYLTQLYGAGYITSNNDDANYTQKGIQQQAELARQQRALEAANERGRLLQAPAISSAQQASNNRGQQTQLYGAGLSTSSNANANATQTALERAAQQQALNNRGLQAQLSGGGLVTDTGAITEAGALSASPAFTNEQRAAALAAQQQAAQSIYENNYLSSDPTITPEQAALLEAEIRNYGEQASIQSTTTGEHRAAEVTPLDQMKQTHADQMSAGTEINPEAVLQAGLGEEEIMDKLSQYDALYKAYAETPSGDLTSEAKQNIRSAQKELRKIVKEYGGNSLMGQYAQQYFELFDDVINYQPGEAGSKLSYTVGRFASGLAAHQIDLVSGVETLFNRSVRGTAYSNEMYGLAQYFNSNPSEYDLLMNAYFGGDLDVKNTGSKQNSEYVMTQIAERTGVDKAVLKSFALSELNSYAEQLCDERLAGENVSDTYKNTWGDWAFTIGTIVSDSLYSAGAAGGEGGIIGNLIEGEGIKSTVLNALKGNATTLLMGVSSAGSKLNQEVKSGSDTGGAATASILAESFIDGYIEMFTETLFGFSDMSSFESFFGTPTASAAGSILKGFMKYIASGFEEGLEEVVNDPLDALAEKLTHFENGFSGWLKNWGTNWFGSGGVFDIKQMAKDGWNGAVVGWLMGGVGAAGGIIQSVQEGQALSQGVDETNALIDEINKYDLKKFGVEVPEKLVKSRTTLETLQNTDAAIVEAQYKIAELADAGILNMSGETIEFAKGEDIDSAKAWLEYSDNKRAMEKQESKAAAEEQLGRTLTDEEYNNLTAEGLAAARNESDLTQFMGSIPVQSWATTTPAQRETVQSIVQSYLENSGTRMGEIYATQKDGVESIARTIVDQMAQDKFSASSYEQVIPEAQKMADEIKAAVGTLAQAQVQNTAAQVQNAAPAQVQAQEIAPAEQEIPRLQLPGAEATTAANNNIQNGENNNGIQGLAKTGRENGRTLRDIRQAGTADGHDAESTAARVNETGYQRIRADDRRTYAETHERRVKGTEISSRAADGSEVYELSDKYVSADKELKAIRDKAAKLGISITFYVHQMSVKSGNSTLGIDGLATGDRIAVQADSEVAATKIAEHEMYHIISKRVPGFKEAARKAMAELGEDALMERVAKYLNSYGSEFYEKNADGSLRVDENGEYILTDEGLTELCDEIAADAFANWDRYGARASEYYNLINEMVSNTGILEETERGPPTTESGQNETPAELKLPGGENLNDDVKFALAKDPRKITREDVMNLLLAVKGNELDYATYFPIRAHTPQTVIDSVKAAEAAGIIPETGITDRPFMMQVGKAYGDMDDIENGDDNYHPHGLSETDIINIIVKLNKPEKVFYQKDGRICEIVKVHTTQGSPITAIVVLEESKDERYMNGYEGGVYNLLLTTYTPDSKRLNDYINNPNNIEIPIKKEATSRSGSGIMVPSHSNDIAFFEDTIAQNAEDVKTEDSKGSLSISENQSGLQLPGDERYSFSSRGINNSDIAGAEALEDQGKSRDEIWQKYGIIRDTKGNWVREIDDSGMTYNPEGIEKATLPAVNDPEYEEYEALAKRMYPYDKTLTDADFERYYELGEKHPEYYQMLSERSDDAQRADRIAKNEAYLKDVLEHSELYDSYPELKRAKVTFVDDDNMLKGGSWSRGTNTITLNRNALEEGESVLLHEVQHAIQAADKRPSGANPDYYAKQDERTLSRISEERAELAKKLDKLAEGTGYNEFMQDLDDRYFADEINDDEADTLEADWIRDNMSDEYKSVKAEYEELGRRYEDIVNDKVHNDRDFRLYRNTAGEIESRETQRRRSLTATERRSKTPDLGWDRAVFAEDAGKNSEEYYTNVVAPAYGVDLEQTRADVKAGKAVTNEAEFVFSLSENDNLGEKADKKNKKFGRISADIFQTAIKHRAEIAAIYNDPALASKLNLPKDIMGKTWFSDSSYGGTEENSTVCERSMAVQSFMDLVAKDLGRPLKLQDTLYIAQELASTVRPECWYCYVATDRRAYRDFMSRYLEERDSVVERLRSGEDPEKVKSDWLGSRKDTDDKKVKRTGKTRLGTKGRFNMWQQIANGEIAGGEITGADVASIEDLVNEMDELNANKHRTAEQDARLQQLDDIVNYAQSASWAKKMTAYAAYDGHILNWSDSKVKKLNAHYGSRMYSFSDSTPAYILEDMQRFTDFAVVGSKVLAYNKNNWWVETFAPTGANINISVFLTQDSSGNIMWDGMMGADIEEAKRLREQYPNVGITCVVTNDTLKDYAKQCDFVDVVLPTHLVRTGAEALEYFGYTNYTDVSSDKVSAERKAEEKAAKDAGEKTEKKDKSISPAQHDNDIAKYIRAIQKAGLTPRFESELTGWREFLAGDMSEQEFRDANPYYMKFVNETRQSQSETKPVQPIFNIEAAKGAIQQMIDEGGFNPPLAGTEEKTQAWAEMIADDIREGLHLPKVEENGTAQKAADDLEAIAEDGAKQIAAEMSGDDTKFAVSENQTGLQLPGTETEAEDQNEEDLLMESVRPANMEEWTAARNKKLQAAQGRTIQALRESIKKTEAKISVLKQLKRTAGLSDQQMDLLSSYEETRDIFKSVLEEKREAEAKEKAEQKEIDTSRVTAFKERQKFGTNMLDLFNIPDGERARYRKALDNFAEEIARDGRVTEERREQVFNAMLAGSLIRIDPETEVTDAFSKFRGRKIYVSPAVKSELGDDWSSLRKAAWGVGVSLVQSDPAGATYALEDLPASEIMNSTSEDGDYKGKLKDIIELGRSAKPWYQTSNEYAQQISMQYGDEAVNDYIDDLEAKMDDAIREFAAANHYELEYRKKVTELNARNAAAKAAERMKRAEQVRMKMVRQEQSAARQTIFNNIKKLSRMYDKTTPAYQKMIHEAIGSIDTVARSISAAGIEDLQELRQVYEDAKEAAGNNWISNPYVEERLSRLDKIQLDDMDFADVVELGKLVSGITTQIQNANQMIDDDRYLEIETASRDAIAEAEAAKGPSRILPGILTNHLLFDQLGAKRAITMMGGWRTGGAMEHLAETLEQGQTAMLDHQMRASNVFNDFLKSKDAQKWLKTASGKNAELISYTVPGLPVLDENGNVTLEDVTFEITPMMRVALYMHSLNEDNLRHIEDGGIVLPDMDLYKKGNTQDAYLRGKKVKLKPATVRAIANDATEMEREYAKYLQKYYDEVSTNDINMVSMKLDGFERATVKHYYPIEVAREYLGKMDPQELQKYQKAESVGSIANERKHGLNPIDLNDASDTLLSKIDETSKYYGYSIPIRNWEAVYNRLNPGTADRYGEPLVKVIGNKWGTNGTSYISQLMQDLQSPGNAADSLSGVLSALKGKLAGATLMFNPSVALSQTASYPGAMQTVGVDGLAAGLKLWHKVDTKLIEMYSPLYWYRNQGYSSEEMAAYSDEFDWAKKAPAIFGWIQKMDSATIRRLWAACEYRVTQDTGLKPGTEDEVNGGKDQYYQKVAEVFNRAVYDTQPNYTTMQQAQIQRSKQAITKMLTMYKTVPLQYYGMMVEATGKLNTAVRDYKADSSAQNKQALVGAQKYAAKTYTGLLLANILYVAVKYGFKVLRGKDKDYEDEEGQKTFTSVSSQLSRDFMETCAGSVIGADILYKVLEHLIDKNLKNEETTWYDLVEITAVETINDTLSDFVGFFDALHDYRSGKDDASELRGIIYDMALQVGQYFGLPTTNIESYLTRLISVISPMAGIELENWQSTITKSKLAGYSGKALDAAIEVAMDNRCDNLSDSTTAEIVRLFEDGNGEVVPGSISQSWEWKVYDDNGEELGTESYTMGKAERKQYSDMWAATVGTGLNDLMDSDEYKQASDAERVKMIKNLYSYATYEARRTITGLDYYQSSSCTWADAAGIAAENDVPIGEFVAARTYAKTLKSDKDEDGKVIKGSSAKDKANDYIVSLDWNTGAKDALYNSLGTSYDANEAEWNSEYSGADYDAYTGLSDTTAAKYESQIAPLGISASVFYEAYSACGDMTADKDKDGKTISGSKKEKVFDYINSLKLTSKQKDALAVVIGGYKEDTVKEDAPWHTGKISLKR